MRTALATALVILGALFGVVVGMVWLVDRSPTIMAERRREVCARVCAPAEYKTVADRCFCTTAPTPWREVKP